MAKKLRAVLVAGLLGLMGRPLAQASLTDGLVAYWPFDEGSGTTALDAVGSNDGTINGGATYTSTGIAPVPGNVSALTFDGIDDFVEIPHANALDMTGTYTLSAWVNIPTGFGYQPILFRGAHDANDIEVYWHPTHAGITLVHNRGNGGPFEALIFPPFPIGKLFHLAIVFDGTVVRGYYDSVLVGAYEKAAPLATDKGWWIGRVDHYEFTNQFFTGLIDEVRIYNRALSESEIAALANLSPPSTCETDLAQCEADLTECLTTPVIPDRDGDGEADGTDECPNTPPAARVDQAGCSHEQFCAAIDVSTGQGVKVCEQSDWQNDEPLMKAKEADCQVEKNGPGRADDRCVPTL